MKKNLKITGVLLGLLAATAFIGCDDEPTYSEADFFEEIDSTAWAFVTSNTDYGTCTNASNHYTESSTGSDSGYEDGNWVTTYTTATQEATTEDYSGIFIYFYSDGSSYKANIGNFTGTKTTAAYTYKVEVQTNSVTGEIATFPNAADKALQKANAGVTYDITSYKPIDTSSISIYGSVHQGFDVMALSDFSVTEDALTLYTTTCLAKSDYSAYNLKKDVSSNALKLYYQNYTVDCTSYTDASKTVCTGTMTRKSYGLWTKIDVADAMKGSYSASTNSSDE